MDLSKRLARLRPNRGAGGPGPSPHGLEQRLRRLRVGRGSRSAQSPNEAEGRLAADLGAEQLEPGLLRLQRRFRLCLRHGDVPLTQLAAPLSALPDLSASTGPGQYLFLDTETTGLSGGTGTLAFLVGTARVEGDALTLTQYLLTRYAAEPHLLREIRLCWGGNVTLVTFNGKTFDLPLLATRCRLASVDGPRDSQRHIDLLPLTRRAFGGRWPDCSLAQAERRLLGFRRVGDLPGSEAPQAWFDFLRWGRIGPLEGVVRHNRLDLISLAALLPSLDRVCREPWRSGADVLSLARAYLARGREQDAIELLQLRREASDEPETGLFLARLLRRQGRWTEAVSIWQRLAGGDTPEALERLAKYHEHHTGRLASALRYAERLPNSPRALSRQQRLRRKLTRGRDIPKPGAVESGQGQETG